MEACPALCRSLAPRAAEVAAARDDALRRKILNMVVADDATDAGAGAAAADVNDADADGGYDAATTERFSVAQATLLALLNEEVASAPAAEPSYDNNDNDGDADDAPAPDADAENHPPPLPTLVLSEGTLAYALDLTSRAAAATQRAAAAAETGGAAAAGAATTDAEAETEALAAKSVLQESLSLLRRLTVGVGAS